MDDQAFRLVPCTHTGTSVASVIFRSSLSENAQAQFGWSKIDFQANGQSNKIGYSDFSNFICHGVPMKISSCQNDIHEVKRAGEMWLVFGCIGCLGLLIGLGLIPATPAKSQGLKQPVRQAPGFVLMVGAALVVTSFVLWIINGYMRIHNLAKNLKVMLLGLSLASPPSYVLLLCFLQFSVVAVAWFSCNALKQNKQREPSATL